MKRSNCLLTVAAVIIVFAFNTAWADSPAQGQKILRQIGECRATIMRNFIDISELSAPSKLSTLQETKGICGLAIENDVLIAGTPKGLLFYDISTPDSPVQTLLCL